MIPSPGIEFFRLIPEARQAQRADRSARGSLPTRATRYCDAVTSASGWGWHVFAPLEFSLWWDGDAIFWTYGDIGEWLPLDAVQFPHFAAHFDGIAPDEAKGGSPPFLTALPEPGGVQVWTGLLAKTAPGWSLLTRSPVNLPPTGGVSLFEGIVETDTWFGPLFATLRLTRTNTLIPIRMDAPLAQVQPLCRATYAQQTLAAATFRDTLTSENWADYIETVVRPSDDINRGPGSYAVAARKRRRAECPFSTVGPRAEPALSSVRS